MSLELSEQEQLRRRSLAALRELGIEPYPAAMFDVTATAAQITQGLTADNAADFADSTKLYETAQSQLDSSKSPSKKVWLDIYNAADNFLSSTYQPLLQKYDKLLNLQVEYIGGDGQTESNITNRLGNPGEYDAFAINMVKTDNGSSYTSLLA